MIKERASEGDDLAKLVQERFGDKPDSLLVRFLRARKFDVSRAHELMKGEGQRKHNIMCRHSLFSTSVIIYSSVFGHVG